MLFCSTLFYTKRLRPLGMQWISLILQSYIGPRSISTLFSSYTASNVTNILFYSFFSPFYGFHVPPSRFLHAILLLSSAQAPSLAYPRNQGLGMLQNDEYSQFIIESLNHRLRLSILIKICRWPPVFLNLGHTSGLQLSMRLVLQSSPLFNLLPCKLSIWCKVQRSMDHSNCIRVPKHYLPSFFQFILFSHFLGNIRFSYFPHLVHPL